MLYDEMLAHLMRDELSTKHFYKMVAEKKPGLLQGLLDRIRAFGKGTGAVGEAVSERAAKAEQLFMDALEEVGYSIEDGKIVGIRDNQDTMDEKGVDNSDSKRYNKTDWSKKKYTPMDISTITRESFYHHAWATNDISGVLTPSNIAEFNRVIGEAKRGITGNLISFGEGYFIAELGDYKFGTSTVFVITDDVYEEPSIEAVYKINYNTEEGVNDVRDFLYERASYGEIGRMEESFETYAGVDGEEGLVEFTPKGGISFAEFSKERAKRAGGTPTGRDSRNGEDGRRYNSSDKQLISDGEEVNIRKAKKPNQPSGNAFEEAVRRSGLDFDDQIMADTRAEAIPKLYISEEIGDIHKFYLAKIEMVPVDSRVLVKNEYAPNSSTDTNISVAQIYQFRKICYSITPSLEKRDFLRAVHGHVMLRDTELIHPFSRVHRTVGLGFNFNIRLIVQPFPRTPHTRLRIDFLINRFGNAGMTVMRHLHNIGGQLIPAAFQQVLTGCRAQIAEEQHAPHAGGCDLAYKRAFVYPEARSRQSVSFAAAEKELDIQTVNADVESRLRYDRFLPDQRQDLIEPVHRVNAVLAVGLFTRFHELT